jgi:hypothetical protein
MYAYLDDIISESTVFIQDDKIYALFTGANTHGTGSKVARFVVKGANKNRAIVKIYPTSRSKRWITDNLPLYNKSILWE